MNEPHLDPEARPTADSASRHGESSPDATGTPSGSTDSAFSEDEKTVISSNTPSTFHNIPPGLRPRELGQLLVGQRLDDLWLEQYVGGGGMGAVFRALDTRLHRHVAVKVLPTGHAGDIDTARRFQVEAQSAARLDHPNIARVYYVGEDRGVPYIVFEYIDGTNLRDLVYQNGPLPVADAVDYTIQIADALLHAWQREVVHRDIKPSNILITQQGQAKLVDMGLARFHQLEHADGELTSSGMTLGTFDYIAPEQARNPKEADTRSDIYSLGCTLYFMLTGQPPFSGGTALQKLLQHQAEAPPAVEQFRADVPTAVVSVMEGMLAKRIEDRFQSPGELLATLTAAADGLGIGHAPLNVAPMAFPDRSSQSWIRRNASWVVPILLLVVGVAAMELILRDPPEQPGFLEDLPNTEAQTSEGATSEFDERRTTSTPPAAASDAASTTSRPNTVEHEAPSTAASSVPPATRASAAAQEPRTSVMTGENGPLLTPPLRGSADDGTTSDVPRSEDAGSALPATPESS